MPYIVFTESMVGTTGPREVVGILRNERDAHRTVIDNCNESTMAWMAEYSGPDGLFRTLSNYMPVAESQHNAAVERERREREAKIAEVNQKEQWAMAHLRERAL